jgi:lipopolysaccharide/colanic/teichoic acid biosynthesis glycosyltransferase
MAGAVVLVIVLVLFPVLVIMSGAVLSATIGELLFKDGRNRNEGSELLDLPD